MIVLGAVAVVLAVLLVVVVVWAVGRRHAERRETAGFDEDLVARLTDEVRKWRAEATYWRTAAERLQRELDGR